MLHMIVHLLGFSGDGFDDFSISARRSSKTLPTIEMGFVSVGVQCNHTAEDGNERGRDRLRAETGKA